MSYKDHELYIFIKEIIMVIIGIFFLWIGFSFVFVGALGLVFVADWHALILLLILLIGIFLLVRGFKIIKKFPLSSDTK